MSYETLAAEKAAALRASGKALILAFESSCDETSVALVENGRKLLSLEIASQISTHVEYGGVVPEIASRMHVEAIGALTTQALKNAGKTLEDVDAIAVTAGPGLVGALLVGVSYAKSLAWVLKKPLYGVHHIQGHISANYLEHPDLNPPFVCLVVSGGHTQLVEVTESGLIRRATTRDDAAGEAFDKGARAMGLPYPGGKHLDLLAREGNPHAFTFPKVKVADAPLDFSFSGLKTNLIQRIHKEGEAWVEAHRADLAASYQEAIVSTLAEHSRLLMETSPYRTLAIAGGVAANSGLRARLQEEMAKLGKEFVCPRLILCTDNAAMIGAAAFQRVMKAEPDRLDLNALPSLPLA